MPAVSACLVHIQLSVGWASGYSLLAPSKAPFATRRHPERLEEPVYRLPQAIKTMVSLDISMA